MAAVASPAMGVAGPSSAALLGPAADFVRPDFHQVNLDVEGYLKQERNYKLDSGKSIHRTNRVCVLTRRRRDMPPLPPTTRLPSPARRMPIPPYNPFPSQLPPPTPSTHAPSRTRKETHGMQTLPAQPVQDGRQLRVHTRLEPSHHAAVHMV